MREFITGNQAIVRGALRAGCDFFAGYPITPASSILSEFMSAFSQGPCIAVQTEDEIAAIGQCIGAAMAGRKALTATSGPGLSLYSENIGLAQMGEVPLVIVDCQRMGPSTGGATASGDGDVCFAANVTAGGYPIPVLAATDAESAYRLTVQAFNIAESLRTPVILLASKAIVMTRQSVDLESIELPPIVSRKAANGTGEFFPYRFASPEDVPEFAPIGGARRVRFTGSIHDEYGLITNDPVKIERKLTHLYRKIDARADALELVQEDLDPESEVLVISYGAADGAAVEAVASARAKGTAVSHLTLYCLSPAPESAVRRALTPRIRRVVLPELNIGLYARVLRPLLGGVLLDSIRRYDGGLIAPAVIETAILKSLGAGVEHG